MESGIIGVWKGVRREMMRTNIFKLEPAGEQTERLFKLADNCSRMYNEINYKRRQSFFSGNFDWKTDEEYNRYKKLVGSATAQQIVRKNNEAWKSFFALLKKWKKGALERKPRPPGYWKDRRSGERKLRISIRCDCYRLEGGVLRLPFGLKMEWKGKNRWNGKQGRLEIVFDELSKKWYAYMPVEVRPPHQPIGNKKAYIDLGVINILTTWIEADRRATIYSGRLLLSDWWYWNKRIAEHQTILKNVNKKHASKKLKKLFQKQKGRFRQAINTMVYRFVKDCYEKGVREIIVGDLTRIRENGNKGRKTNSMINNFWSFKYITERIRTTAENFGIVLTKKDEGNTSKTCCLCGKVHKNGRRHRGLYICKTHNKAINADVNGVANIANPIFPEPVWSRDNWVVANPSVVKTTVEPPML